MIQRSLALVSENQWTYNIVNAPRDEGFFDSRTRIHANKWLGIQSKLDPIFPAYKITHRCVYVGLECGFLGVESADGP